jgi:hypothetical protein
MAKLALGIAADAAGAPGEGRAALQEAVRVFEDIGMTFMAQRAGLELDRMSGDAVQAERRRAWFALRGLGGGVAIADRYFPSRGGQPPAEPRVMLRVLGPVTLEKGGKAIPYRGRKRSEILAYLLEVRLAGRGGASLLELADAIYPGVPEPEARATIKQQVYLIRSSLGSDSILSTGNGYALGTLATDAEDFLRGGDGSLWRGAYLDGLGEGWHAGVRDALLLGLTARVESLIERAPAEAARLALLLCRMEPYSLPALGLAVAALLASGDERVAAQAYAEARVRLLEVGERLPESVADFPAPPSTIPSRHSTPAPR